ncbi:MAG: aminotransferase class V-fold PLP-dependent enzyme [Myxococcales bacterium]|nr:aminotransferase class V-fold PLP-dependent enzyme [Myxococcales bacterium]
MDGRPPIYLDYNATTPIEPEVREAMLPWLGERWGNPSSGHAYGAQAAEAVAAARAEVAALIGAPVSAIVFTGGGTEADNLALLGAARGPGRLVISAVEHPAVDAPAAALAAQGWLCERLPVGADGRVDLERAAALVGGGAEVALASVILAQNESGAIQPVAELAAMIRRRSPGALIHSDAAQAVGKIAVDVDALGVDLLTVVSHKLYGPAGIGALYVRDRAALRPRLLGGGQEGGLRPGTEPVALIVGLGAAAALARRTLAAEGERQRGLRERLWGRLEAAIPGLHRTIPGAIALPNTLHVCVPGLRGADLLSRAPALAASVGSACHSHDDAVSGVLGAMGVPASLARGALRLSLGRRSDAAAIDAAADALIAAWRSLA